MKRYMLRLSYIGTHYRGSQKHTNNCILDIDSIQGAIESTLYTIRPKFLNVPNIVMAGRTDAGVHAICTTAHVDLEHSHRVQNFDTTNLVKLMNRYLFRCGHEIRIYSCHEVSKDFHARFSAKSRTYLYRFLVPKDPTDHKIPLLETSRTMHLHPHSCKFDIERLQKGVDLFKGKRDFATFSAKSRNKHDKESSVQNFVRTMDISLQETEPLMPSDPLSKNFHYWNIICTSRAFLYNQIRRIVGALFALGLHKLSEDDILTMLQVPSQDNWNPHATPAQPHGLYLMNVEYDEKDTRQICS